MEISTNKIGNYGPGYTQQVKAKPRVNNEAALSSLQKNERINTERINTERINTEKINNEEMNFFINLYPENKKEITDYHFYQKSGKMSGVALGSLFDRKG